MPKLNFSQLPSIDQLLNAEHAATLIAEFGTREFKRVTRIVLEELRGEIKRDKQPCVDLHSVCARASDHFQRQTRQRLRPVINLSGTVLHTNLGRATLPQASIDAVVAVMESPGNVEFNLATGKRGDRESDIEQQICRLTGAEAATIVNNNAAAILLTLNTLALGKEVLVSRGELVEIGGSFRISDIIVQSGAVLTEVGTTNRTHPRDYQAALGEESGLILKVHQSNYVIEGFTASVDEGVLSPLAVAANIPLVTDLGSGALLDMSTYGLPRESTPMDGLKSGADIVTFSGDKLLGGPQAGFIIGRRGLVEKIKKNPIKRALRCDKMTIAAMSALLGIYADPDHLADRLPVLKLLTRSVGELQGIAEQSLGPLADIFSGLAEVSIVKCESEIGSGALPKRGIPSIAIAFCPVVSNIHHHNPLSEIAAAFRALPIPVIGRIYQQRFLLDMRCLNNVDEFIGQLGGLRDSL